MFLSIIDFDYLAGAALTYHQTALFLGAQQNQRVRFSGLAGAIAGTTAVTISTYWMSGDSLLWLELTSLDQWRKYIFQISNFPFSILTENMTCLFFFLMQPEGAANNNYLVQYALALVSSIFQSSFFSAYLFLN